MTENYTAMTCLERTMVTCVSEKRTAQRHQPRTRHEDHAESTCVDGGCDLKSELQMSTHMVSWKPAAKCVADHPIPRRK